MTNEEVAFYTYGAVYPNEKIRRVLMEPEVMILLSGGLDSTACVNFYVDFRRPPIGIFIDYGQLAVTHELKSAKAVSDYYSIPFTCLTWKGWLPKTIGMIPARNLFLISAAMMERPNSVSVIALGIHSGVNYPDSSETFLSHMQSLINIYEHGKVQLAAPFITWTKSDIYTYCRRKGVPTELTYSCERGGNLPCGECLSCKDREMLYACT